MLDLDSLDNNTLNDILNGMPGDDDDCKLGSLQHDSIGEAFEKYLNYNGIIGYAPQIKRAFINLLNAEIPLISSPNKMSWKGGLYPLTWKPFIERGESYVITRTENDTYYVRKLEV